MGDVVRTRLPLTLVSALGSLIVFALFGGGGENTHTRDESSVGPLGLIMLIPVMVVDGRAMEKRHIITEKITGSRIGLIIVISNRLLIATHVHTVRSLPHYFGVVLVASLLA